MTEDLQDRSFKMSKIRGKLFVGGACVSLLALALSGCAVGPDFVASAAPDVNGYTAEKLKGAGGQKFVKDLDLQGEWWKLFRSKSLNRLVETALANNHDLKAAEAALKVAKEAVAAQKGFFYPQVNAQLATSRQYFSQNGTLSPNINSSASFYNLVTPQLNISYTPDVWGLNRRTVESLQAQADMAKYQLNAAHLTLTSNVALGAIQEASLRGQIAATQRAIKTMRDLLVVLKKEKAIGQAAEVDVAAQEAALAQAETALPVLEKQLAQTRDLLTALTGGMPSQPVPETFELGGLHLPEKVPVTLPAKLIWQRPDVAAADENLHSASALVGVALANRLPNLTVTGDMGSTATSFAGLFGAANNFWTLGAQLSAPIFDGGTLMHRQAGAEAAYVETVEQYKSTVVNAFQNVADSLRAIQHDATGLRVAMDAERAAEKSLRITLNLKKLGQASQAQVLLAEQTYLNAVVNKVQAEALRYSDTVAMFQALGGGWWNRMDDDPAKIDAIAQTKIVPVELYPGPKQVKAEDYQLTGK